MRYLIIATSLFVFTACEKNKLAQKEETSPAGSAYVKLGHFAQYSTPTNLAVQLKFDDTRVSNTFVSNTPYPGGGFNTGGNSFADYLSVTPGNRKLTLSVPTTGTANDSIVRFSGNVDVAANIRQTVMITDTGANTAATVITDDVTPPETPGSYARAKFFNGMPGSTLDLYIRTPNGTVRTASGIAYKSVSSYFDFFIGNTADTLDVVNAGTAYTATTTPLARYVWAPANIIQTRVYTILSSGYPSVLYTATTDNRRSRVSVVLNR